MVDRSSIFEKRRGQKPASGPGENSPTANEIRDRRELELHKLSAEIERLQLANNSAYPALESGRPAISDSEALEILLAERSRVLTAMQGSKSGGAWTKCVASLEKVQRLIFLIQGVLDSGGEESRPFVFVSADDLDGFVSKYIGPCPADFPG